MSQRAVSATRFKAQCLGLFDEVARTGETIVVTKHGKPVVKVVPVDEPASLVGSVTFNVSDDDLIYLPLDEWEVDRE